MHSIKLSRDGPGGQWLRLRTPGAGSQVLPLVGEWGGTRSHMPQLKILHVTTKTSAISKINIKKMLSKLFLN